MVLEVRRKRAECLVNQPSSKKGRPEKYLISVRGGMPGDLNERIGQAHATFLRTGKSVEEKSCDKGLALTQNPAVAPVLDHKYSKLRRS